MHYTPKKAVNTTRKPVLRMFRILAVMMPLCLALGLSFSSPASAHQARPTIPASCTAAQTWTFSIPTGDVTVYSDNFEFPGPGTSNEAHNITVMLDASNNVCGFSLTDGPITVTDHSGTGNTIHVDAITPCSPAGTFNPSTGVLTLTGTLTLSHLQIIQGSVTTECGSLGTSPPVSPVTTNGGVTLTGSPVDSSGNVTVVGTTSFTDLITVHTWAKIVGTFTHTS